PSRIREWLPGIGPALAAHRLWRYALAHSGAMPPKLQRPAPPRARCRPPPSPTLHRALGSQAHLPTSFAPLRIADRAPAPARTCQSAQHGRRATLASTRRRGHEECSREHQDYRSAERPPLQSVRCRARLDPARDLGLQGEEIARVAVEPL